MCVDNFYTTISIYMQAIHTQVKKLIDLYPEDKFALLICFYDLQHSTLRM